MHSDAKPMPRIAPLQHLREDDENKLRQIAQTFGYRPNALATMAHKPGLPSSITEMIACIMQQPGYLSEPLRYLLACEAGRHGGSPYTTTHLAHAAHHAGATWAQVNALATGSADHVFSAQERALFALAAPFLDARQKEAAWSAAKTYWSDPALAEACAIIAAIAMFTRWNTLMETVLESEPASALVHVPWLTRMATAQAPRN